MLTLKIYLAVADRRMFHYNVQMYFLHLVFKILD